MNYFNDFKMYLVCWIFILICIIIIVINLVSTNSNEEDNSISVGVSIGNSNGGIGMSTNDNVDDGFVFKEKSKLEVDLQKFNPDNYKITNFLDTMLIGNVIDVPFINQTVKYPTGCESVSATSVLQYYGIEISVDKFIDDYLPMAELKIIGYKRNNEKILSSMHPNEYFIGNPKSGTGLGCYENTIADTIVSVLEDYKLLEYFTVTPSTKLSIEDIQNYLDDDIPVIMWATQNMVNSEEGLHWYLGNTDKVFQYMKNEHCLVAIGYDDDYIYFNDTLIGRVAYPKNLVEDRYNQMGSRTVTIVYNG